MSKQGLPPLPSTRGVVTASNIPELPVGAAVVVDPKTQAVTRSPYDPLHPNTPAIPCGTCGTPTTMIGTKRCDGCWEVEHRLRGYLKLGGEKARRFVAALMKEYPCAEPK